MIDYRDTLLAQYANSPTITAMIESFNDCLDPSEDINNIYSMFWDINTAVGYGLDVWGKIVGVTRQIKIDLAEAYLGFDEASLGDPPPPDGSMDPLTPQPFGQATFYNEQNALSGTHELTDAGYRRLIMVKAMANITDCTVPSLNKLLRLLFANRGKVYVRKESTMAIAYVFEFRLTAVELGILKYTAVAPAPAGVEISIVQIF